MIRHLDEGELQALLDGELVEGAAAEARRHVAGCEACGAELNALREASAVLAAALPALDSPRRSANPRLAPPSTRSRWFRRGFALPKAATLLVAFTAAAFAAVPGSPVRDWIERYALAPSGTVADAPDRAEAIVASGAADDAADTGVSADLANGRLRILLTRPGPDLRIRAVITEEPRAWVYAIGDSVTATFNTSAGAVEVVGASDGELRIEIPAIATSATVEIDGRPYLTKDGDQLRLLAAPGERSGAEITFPAY